MEPSERAFLRTFILALVLLHLSIGVVLAIARTIGNSHTYVVGEYGEIDKRTSPVAIVNTIALQPASKVSAAPAAPRAGKDIVGQVCSACHGSGVLGAPRIGDAAAWQGRMARDGGLDGLAAIATKGKGNMPPRGGQPDLSDQEIRNAVQAMLQQSGVK